MMLKTISSREPALVIKKDSKQTSFLENRISTICLVLFFSFILLVWLALDQSVPGFDPAWHAIWSGNVKRFLTHYKEWSADNLLALVRQHFGYASLPWFINGFIKIFCSNPTWADKLCLLVHYTTLLTSTFIASNLAFKSRTKANCTIVVLASCPLICVIAHVPLIDLLHTAAFTCFLAVLYWREQNRSWRLTGIAALTFGLYCCTKQIAVLFGGSALAFLFVQALAKKDLNECLKLTLIGLSGPIFLLSWILPNLDQIRAYCESRGQLGSNFSGRISLILEHSKTAIVQIGESISTPLLLSLMVLGFNSNFKKNFQSTAMVSFSAVSGFILTLTLFYFNTPDSRYFGPVIVPFAMLMGGVIGDCLTNSRFYKKVMAYFILTGAPLLMLALCFSQAPYVKRPRPEGVSPIVDLCGIKQDILLRSHLACDTRKDAWKQHWVFDTIETVEKQRYVWLNVLPGTYEFNPGSMGYIAQCRKSHVIPISWRKCNADMTDSFTESIQQAAWVDWFVLKTGFQGSSLPQHHQKIYQDMIDHVENSGDFNLIAQSELPDHSILKLYRKNYVREWNRNSVSHR